MSEKHSERAICSGGKFKKHETGNALLGGENKKHETKIKGWPFLKTRNMKHTLLTMSGKNGRKRNMKQETRSHVVTGNMKHEIWTDLVPIGKKQETRNLKPPIRYPKNPTNFSSHPVAMNAEAQTDILGTRVRSPPVPS